MSERRVIRVYRPRVTIPIETMLPEVTSYSLYCLSNAHVGAIMRLAQYLKRQLTFVYEHIDKSYYKGPTFSEWEVIQDVVAEMELNLMSGCDFSTIESILSALQACVCENTDINRRIAKELVNVGPYITEGTLTAKTPEQVWGNPTAPGTDDERCEYAQAVYYQAYEAYVEYLFPFADQASDVILGYLVASTGFTALAGMAGLPLSLAATIVGMVVDVAIDSSIANFTSWMLASKDEIICALYTGLPDFATAAANVRSYVDAASEISFLDKQLLKQMIGSEWWIRWVCQDQEENGTWDAYLVPGQCDDCEPSEFTCHSFPPCDNADWFPTGGDGVCYDGRPRCYPGIGVIRHLGSTLTPNFATGNRYKLTITGEGGTGPISVAARWVRTEAPTVNFEFWSGTVNPGETKTVEGTFNTTAAGYVHQLQLNNSPYFVYVDQICMADPE